jgi:hypothetical protein
MALAYFKRIFFAKEFFLKKSLTIFGTIMSTYATIVSIKLFKKPIYEIKLLPKQVTVLAGLSALQFMDGIWPKSNYYR